ncbi:hydrogenase iron-sulfur subunit [Thermosulfuriphilus sp.]
MIGSGPAGLACAFYLALAGYPVTIFEAQEKPGGMLRYGISEYQLAKDLLNLEIELIRQTGVEIRCGQRISGQSLFELKKDFRAIFLAIGRWQEPRLGYAGEKLSGVYYALEFLKRINTDQRPDVGQRVAVVGSGDTAIEAARCALRLGAKEVTIYCQGLEKEISTWPSEVAAAREEGVHFEFFVSPISLRGENGRLSAMEYQKLAQPQVASSRKNTIHVEGSKSITLVDTVILAPERTPDKDLIAALGIEKTDDGGIMADSRTLLTPIPGIFAGGEILKGRGSIVRAIAQGKRAAFFIDAYLRGQDLQKTKFEERRRPVSSTEVLAKRPHQAQEPIEPLKRSPEERIHDFREVEISLDENKARAEAGRCLDCAGCCECLQCVQVCEAKAIDHQDREKEIEVEVGSIIVATGFKTFDPSRLQRYGYGRLPEVYTSLEFERLNNASGPTGGEIRLRDGRRPETVAIIHCVGSRDENTHRYCSRVCCMYSMKFAHLVREKTGADVWEFYIDIRSPGKGYEEFYHRLQEEGVHFIRGRVAEVTDAALYKHELGKLIVIAEDTLAGRLRRIPADMVILSVGLEPAEGSQEIARLAGISQDADGWLNELHPKLAPVATATEGIFIAGCCQGPKDIPDTVAQASAAASQALSLIMKGKVEIEPTTASIDPDICVGCRQCLSICSYGAISYKDVVFVRSSVPIRPYRSKALGIGRSFPRSKVSSIEGGRMNKPPKIVGFLCNWCSYTAADLAGISRLKYPPGFHIIRVMCSSRVDPVFVIKALLEGADGVLIAGCHPGDCHYQKGNYYARRRVAMVKKLLETLGLEPQRVRVSWISASEGPRFVEIVQDFTRELKSLGPNLTRELIL